MEEIKSELNTEIKDELKKELRDKIKKHIKSEIKKEIEKEIEDESDIESGIDSNKINICRSYSPHIRQEKEEKNDTLKMKKEMEKAVDNINNDFLSNSIKINVLYGLVAGLYTLGIMGYLYYILHVELTIICGFIALCIITILVLRMQTM